MDKEKLIAEVEARFKHYAPRNEDEIRKHVDIREVCKEAANDLISILPSKIVNTREFSQVLTDLENAMMHANAAYARHKDDV